MAHRILEVKEQVQTVVRLTERAVHEAEGDFSVGKQVLKKTREDGVLYAGCERQDVAWHFKDIHFVEPYFWNAVILNVGSRSRIQPLKEEPT